MRVAIAVGMLLLPVLAFAQARAPQVKRTNPPALSKPTGYTHVVEVTGPAKTIYISGQIAFDKDGKLVGAGDMKAQAEQVFKNLEVALAAAGAKFSDVVKMNSYITDMSKVQAVRDVRARYFSDTAPASTFVQVAGLVRPELLLEVEVVAVVAAPGGTASSR
ncbi:MAG TPA: RidA family protein [Vicinamibacterales bacterium]|nr:RidA family protein [Vicinamibacterales bacterium]